MFPEKDTIPRKRYRYSKSFFICASCFSFLGTVALIVSLASPCWLASKPESNSNFVKLGLWTICFSKYRHPLLKFDGVFDGCYSMYEHRSDTIREWLQPGWFIGIQCLTTAAAVLSMLCLGLLIYISSAIQIHIKLFVAVFAFILQALSALSSFLVACVFGAMCFERSWIQHPQHNVLSWGYFCMGAAIGLLSVAATCILVHTFRIRKALHYKRHLYSIPLSDRWCEM